MGLKLHADEVHDTGGAALAASLRAVSAEHLLAAGEEGLRALVAAGSVAVLLPATAYALRKPYAPARRMVDLGLPVAIATDCNPGSSYTESMPFVFGLAVLGMGLSAERGARGRDAERRVRRRARAGRPAACRPGSVRTWCCSKRRLRR